MFRHAVSCSFWCRPNVHYHTTTSKPISIFLCNPKHTTKICLVKQSSSRKSQKYLRYCDTACCDLIFDYWGIKAWLYLPYKLNCCFKFIELFEISGTVIIIRDGTDIRILICTGNNILLPQGLRWSIHGCWDNHHSQQ